MQNCCSINQLMSPQAVYINSVLRTSHQLTSKCGECIGVIPHSRYILGWFLASNVGVKRTSNPTQMPNVRDWRVDTHRHWLPKWTQKEIVNIRWQGCSCILSTPAVPKITPTCQFQLGSTTCINLLLRRTPFLRPSAYPTSYLQPQAPSSESPHCSTAPHSASTESYPQYPSYAYPVPSDHHPIV